MFGAEGQEERSSTKEEQRDIAVPLPIDTLHRGAAVWYSLIPYLYGFNPNSG